MRPADRQADRKKALTLGEEGEDLAETRDLAEDRYLALKNVGTYGLDLLMERLFGINPDTLDDAAYACARAELRFLTEHAIEIVARGVAKGVAYAFGKGE